MNMKRNILNFMQTGMLRAVVCTCVAGLPFVSAFAQSEDDEEEELGAVIKQPKRVQVEKTTYPMMTLKGMVTDLATGKPLTGIQLQSLGNNRYTAMTDENGAFQIKVPTFVTALYVHAPEFLAQQVAVKAGDSTQVICVKMLSDKFQSMYGTGTDYTAQRTAQINRFGVTVDNEITSKLGGDMRSIMRSAAVDGGASMFIRGLNSITSDAQPLVVVDGIEMDMQRNRTSLHDGQFNNDIISARELVKEVYIDERIENYIVDIVSATRNPENYGLEKFKELISYGGSPRAGISLAKASKAYAFIKRRGYVIPEDVRSICHSVLRHRVGLTYEAEAQNITTEEIISEILNTIPVP